MARVSAGPPPERVVISDFGGVLTTPLIGSFEAFRDRSGVPLAALGQALAAVGIARGEDPLFELETGRLSEVEFLAALGEELTRRLARPVDLSGFGEAYFADLAPNEPFLAYMRQLHDRGYRMALCTNNVREWSATWRAMIPVAEIFEVVVDSSEVGARKPDPRIYELTLEALGVAADAAVFVDDLEINCEGARRLGMRAVRFQDTEQAIAEVEAALRDQPPDATPPPVDK